MSVTMPNGMHLAIRGTWSTGRDIISSWHAVVLPTGDRGPACLQYAGHVLAAWQSNLMPLMQDNYTLKAVDYVDLDSETGTVGSVPKTPPTTGGVTGSAGTGPHQGLLIKKNISGGGRRFRPGRIFIAGAAESSVDEAGLISGGATMVAALQAFLTSCNIAAAVAEVASARLVVAHHPSIKVPQTKTVSVPDPDGVLVATDISGFTADPLVSGIRRRLKG